MEKSRGSTSSMDPRITAKVHYDEMASYLENHLAKGACISLRYVTVHELSISELSEPANARASAREKLTRLTRQQFQELSTDVYDELLRRKNNTENLHRRLDLQK